MNNRKCAALGLCLLVLGACQPQTRQFSAWKWTWPNWNQNPTTAPASQPAASQSAEPREPDPIVSNFFNIQILECAGTDECLQNTWSYLDETSPMSKDWKVLHRNGLRCGIGQYSDWPTLKDQLEKCGSKTRTQTQVTLGGFSPVTLLTDKFRSERTVFYYDREGQVHGRDFGPSRLTFVLTAAGKMPEGRVRLIFSPKIVKPGSGNDQLDALESPRKSQLEQELENFSVIVDLGAREFAMIGPSAKEMASSLVGPQLFSQWNKGQRKSLLILVSPAEVEKNNPSINK